MMKRPLYTVMCIILWLAIPAAFIVCSVLSMLESDEITAEIVSQTKMGMKQTRDHDQQTSQNNAVLRESNYRAAKKAQELRSRRENQKNREARRELATKIEAQLKKFVDQGAIHSIDVSANRVRIDPFLWVNLSLETKQDWVHLFSNYFELKRGYPRVTILSNRNDQKLASYSTWSGVKIYR